MVSNGRSYRGRVGLDQSGSAATRMQGLGLEKRGQVGIGMLEGISYVRMLGEKKKKMTGIESDSLIRFPCWSLC